MGAAGIELWEPVTANTVEKAYRRAMQAMEAGDQRFFHKGMRAARARDERLLLVLEKSAEVLLQKQEAQIGRTQRAESATEGEKADLTEYSLFYKAYQFCDKGEPLEQFGWIYGAAALLAGY